MSLPAVRGHAEVRERLAHAATTGTLTQSILLHGPAGVGKERLALWLAQLLLCERPGPNGPCGACHSCRLAVRVEHPDLHWFFPLPRPDATSPEKLRDKLEEHRAAELQARRANPHHLPSYDRAPAHFLAAVQSLQQLAVSRPAMGRRKVFVVGDAELMVPQESSPEAANAFLKLLEEPPNHTTLILTSSQPGALLPTIRSRVLPLRLSPVPESDIVDYLVAEAGVEPETAERIARTARGAVGRAVRMLPTSDGAGPLERARDRGRELLLAALASNAVARLAAANAQAPAGGRGEFSEHLEALAEWLRDLLAVAGGAPETVEPEARKLLGRAVEQHDIHPLAVTRALEQVTRAQDLAQGNVNPQLVLADLLRRIQEELVPAVGAHRASSR